MKLDKRMQRSRKAIEDAFIRLMMQKTYDNITVADIVKEADYSKTAFYNNFLDKEDLLDSINKKVADDIMQILRQHALISMEELPDSEEARKTMCLQHITAHYDTVYRHRDYFTAMHRSFGSLGVSYVFRHILEMQEKEEVVFKQYSQTELDPSLFNYAHLWDLIGCISWWVINDFKYSPSYMGMQQYLRLTYI